ncbi:membrane-bound transcription factor site-2 protease-like protein [Dinothrombium tinctorium]|uniref:Membrane-bound transcription factor site-2 protease n=1 Tax=Dinothrombium tinctorium TaxID=1965070 RepID=A0A443REL8_9ACAR|nr:membrane-bound transcription factor site-2 protease-like protein [Dinothrombium tinctorium]
MFTVFSLTLQSKAERKGEVLEAVIPGINLPANDLAYYLFSLLLSTSFHEFGHAVAAIKHGVKVHGFGFYVLFVIPAAFVELATEQMMSKSSWIRFKIISAGVWHNIALATIAAFLLFSNNFLLMPMYSIGQGAVVASLHPGSGISGVAGLQNGDVITNLNGDCIVTDKLSWANCLKKILQTDEGYCVPTQFIEEQQFHSLDSSQCCGENSARHLCFEQLGTKNHFCLPVRSLLNEYSEKCNSTIMCSSNKICVKPISNETFKLVVIQRINSDFVLFWGHPEEIFTSVVVIDYRPKFTFLPLIFIHFYENQLRYICSFSLALAVLNAVPCLWLDGHWMIDTIINLFLHPHVSPSKRTLVANFLTYAGTLMVFLCATIGVYNVLRNQVVF